MVKTMHLFYGVVSVCKLVLHHFLVDPRTTSHVIRLLDLPWDFECKVVHPRDAVPYQREANKELVPLFGVHSWLTEVDWCCMCTLR